MRNSDTIHGKNGNAFCHTVLRYPDDSDQRKDEDNRMSELPDAISDRMKSFLRSYKLPITFLLLFVMPSSCFFDNKPKPIIVNDIHEKILVTNIDPVIEKYGLTKLRDFSLYGNDFEIRVWFDGGGLDGFILRHFNNKWSAVAVKDIECNRIKDYKLGMVNLSAPRSGWEKTWHKLEEMDILNLPDYSQLPGQEPSVIDGIGYFVEINMDGKYRTYAYGNPQLQKRQEAEQMMTIGKTISDEFGLHNFEIGSLCIEK